MIWITVEFESEIQSLISIFYVYVLNIAKYLKKCHCKIIHGCITLHFICNVNLYYYRDVTYEIKNKICCFPKVFEFYKCFN
jgi:hypothetical protein